MIPVSPPTLILVVRTGRWAASLRRHGLVEQLRLIETPSLDELEEQLASNGKPARRPGAQSSHGGSYAGMGWPRGSVRRASGIIVLADRSFRPYELPCREAGTAHFVASELELLTLGPVIDRYLSHIRLGDTNGAELSTTDRIRAGCHGAIDLHRARSSRVPLAAASALYLLAASFFEPRRAKHIDWQSRIAAVAKVRQDFAHDAGELESMSREPGGDDNIRVQRMPVDDEMPIGRERVHTAQPAPVIGPSAGGKCVVKKRRRVSSSSPHSSQSTVDGSASSSAP